MAAASWSFARLASSTACGEGNNSVAGELYDRICTSIPFLSMLAILPAPISVSCSGFMVCLEPKSPTNALECPVAIFSISSRVAAVISSFKKCSSIAMIFILL
ncbi:hypothetical protein D3C76_1009910 [compost metagenome]